MEGALIASAVTKEADSYLAFAIELGSKPSPSREGEATTNNAIGSKHSLIHVRNMHRAALATAGSRLAAKQLSHHFAQAHAFGDTVAMTPVMAGDVIIIRQV